MGIFGDGSPSLALLRFLRVALMAEEELPLFAEPSSSEKPVSLENELRVYRILVNMVSSLLQSFPSTVDDDSQLLQELHTGTSTLAPSAATHCAVWVRHSEKVLLHRALAKLQLLWRTFLTYGFTDS